MNKVPEDKDLEDYLKGDSEISQLYQSTLDQEPPAHLDQFILEQANAAASKTLRSKAKTATAREGFFARLFKTAWLVPAASLASVAIIAVMIAVLISSPETGTDKNDNNIAKNRQPATGTMPVNASSMDKKVADKKVAIEHWIKKIQELHKQGKTREAQNSLELFRKKYPDYSSDKLKQALKGTNLIQ